MMCFFLQFIYLFTIYWIFSSFTFQVLSPKGPIPSLYSTHCHFSALVFPCTGAYKFARPRGLSSQWCLTRPSSAKKCFFKKKNFLKMIYGDKAKVELVVIAVECTGAWLVSILKTAVQKSTCFLYVLNKVLQHSLIPFREE